jgi:hypothetical protein
MRLLISSAMAPCLRPVTAIASKSMLALGLVFSFHPLAAAATIPTELAAPTNAFALYQSVSNTDLRRYAATIIEIEPLRLEALNTIQSQVGGQLPDLMCSQPSSMGSLPPRSQKVFVNYCNQANRIAKKHGLNQTAFNRITAQVASDSNLRQRLQRQVVCIQSGSC